MIFVTSIRLTFSSSKYNERRKTLTYFSENSIYPKADFFLLQQIYHLELLRDQPKDSVDEFISSFPNDELHIQLVSVAVVKIDAGATFTTLATATKHARCCKSSSSKGRIILAAAAVAQLVTDLELRTL